jgi:hypothetical protein
VIEIALTRDSVCMGDDVLAPNPGRVTVWLGRDPATIGRAIVASGYLPSVASGSTWHVALAGAYLVLSDRPGQPRVTMVGESRDDAVPGALHLSYDLQRDPAAVAADLAAGRSPRG